jgi:hypothetical protein
MNTIVGGGGADYNVTRKLTKGQERKPMKKPLKIDRDSIASLEVEIDRLEKLAPYIGARNVGKVLMEQAVLMQKLEILKKEQQK